MIRLSQSTDINGIIRLWNEAFGDSEEDIKFFLDARYIPENTVVYEYNGIIASVLFLLDGNMHIKGSDYPSYYLYAACTLKDFRGKGIMGEMLSFSKNLAAFRNKYFIVLKPAEESLYGYYERFGYKSLFSKKTVRLTVNNQSLSKNMNDSISDSELFKIREKAYKDTDYFKWNNDDIDFAIRHHKYFGGNFILKSNGYMLYTQDSDKILVKESTFTTINEMLDILNQTISSDVGYIEIDLPYAFDCESAKYDIIKSGMLLPLNNKAENVASINNAYLNLTLD